MTVISTAARSSTNRLRRDVGICFRGHQATACRPKSLGSVRTFGTGGRMAAFRGSDRRSVADEALVRSLFDEHGRALMAYATRLLGDRHAAEDVVQETLVR